MRRRFLTWCSASARSRTARRFGLAFAVGAGFAGSVAIGSAATTAPQSGTPPASTSAPAISGSAIVGRSLSASTGSWSGDAPITFSFQWQRCGSSGGSCDPIASATAQTYTLVSADVGHTVRVDVSATNGAGTASDLSAPTEVVADGPPANTVPPSVGGTLEIGHTLTVSSGTWSGTQPIAISYQWDRCDGNGGSCATIGGATGAAYKIASADGGHRLVVVVTGTNSLGGSRVVVTAGNIGGGVPVSTAAPRISGSLSIGGTLTVSSGTWSGTQPIAISYQWDRCDGNGGSCATIGGATGPGYKVASADAGHRLVVAVTGKNSLGSNEVVVTAGNVVGGVPVSTAAPRISGSLSIGGTLTVSSGTWSGTQPIAISYQWDRCDGNGGSCATIGGATGPAYRVAPADAGHRLVVVVTGKNSLGSNRVVVTAGNVGGLLPNRAVLVSTLELPSRLVIDRVKFSPSPIRSRTPVTARFHVSDGNGHSVQGALVFALGLPYGWTYNAPETPTGADGWVTLTIRPTRNLPLRRGALVMFIRARKPGGNLLAGISTRRLVQDVIR